MISIVREKRASVVDNRIGSFGLSTCDTFHHSNSDNKNVDVEKSTRTSSIISIEDKREVIAVTYLSPSLPLKTSGRPL